MPTVLRSLAVATTLFLAPCPGAAQPALESGPTPTRAPAIDRCAEFCATFFPSGSRERSECVAGCSDGDACSRTCNGRFPDDPGKQTACYKRCMRSKPT